MDNRIKYLVAAVAAAAFMASTYYLPAETFIAFTAGWLFAIPAAFIAYMVYGLSVYLKERKHVIAVTIKPTEAMKALARREEELRKEKERILYEELRRQQ